jgi:hypothetical protein
MEEVGEVEHARNVTDLLDRFGNQLICPHRFGRVHLIIADMSAQPDKIWGLVTLRQLGCRVPLVMVNHLPDQGGSDEVDRLGAMAVLGTPLDTDRLRRVLRRVRKLAGLFG